MTRKRLYLETMESVLPGVEKVIVEAGPGGAVPAARARGRQRNEAARAVRAVSALALAVLAVAAGNLGIPPVVITREGEQKLVLLLGDVRERDRSLASRCAIPFVER